MTSKIVATALNAVPLASWKGKATGNHGVPNQILGCLGNVALSKRFIKPSSSICSSIWLKKCQRSFFEIYSARIPKHPKQKLSVDPENGGPSLCNEFGDLGSAPPPGYKRVCCDEMGLSENRVPNLMPYQAYRQLSSLLH